MIPYEMRSTRDYLAMLLTVRGSVYRHAIRVSVAAALWGLLCTLLSRRFGQSVEHGIGFAPITHSLLGSSISFLLVNRVQLAYGRFWEARGLLASFGAHVRDFCGNVFTHLDYKRKNKSSLAHRVNLIRLILAMCRHNNAVLRSAGKHDGAKKRYPYLRDFLTEEQRLELAGSPEPHSATLVGFLREAIGRAEDAEMLRAPHLGNIISNMKDATNAMASMQRIMSTPVPIAFTQALEVGLFVFVATLPFVLIPIWKSEKELYATPLIMFLFAFVLYGLKNLAYEIEDPFGDDENDLPLLESQRELERHVQGLLRREACRLDPSRHAMGDEECAAVLAAIESETGAGLPLVSRARRAGGRAQTPGPSSEASAGGAKAHSL